jgi:uncharacterized membrane protein YciS (DUF1049 family)
MEIILFTVIGFIAGTIMPLIAYFKVDKLLTKSTNQTKELRELLNKIELRKKHSEVNQKR